MIQDEGDPHTCGYDPRNDPEYMESLALTQVCAKLAEYAQNWKDYRQEDRDIFLILLQDAYHGLDPTNDWDLDIS